MPWGYLHEGFSVVFIALASGGCATLSPEQADRAAGIAVTARSQDAYCACAAPSTLRQLGDRALAKTMPEARFRPAGEPAAKRGDDTVFATTAAWRGLMEAGQRELLVQTPYLVLSRDLSRWLHAMGQRPVVPRVVLSTNSLGSTDTPAVYALTHKYKRRLSHVFGMTMHEYKPYPGVGWEPADGDVPRRGLHAKSFVVDERIGVVGSHNLDPRSDHYNIESLLVVDDPAFARAGGEHPQ